MCYKTRRDTLCKSETIRVFEKLRRKKNQAKERNHSLIQVQEKKAEKTWTWLQGCFKGKASDHGIKTGPRDKQQASVQCVALIQSNMPLSCLTFHLIVKLPSHPSKLQRHLSWAGKVSVGGCLGIGAEQCLQWLVTPMEK